MKEQVRIRACRRLRGTIRVPGDKSITHRAILLGAMATGRTEIRDPLWAEDCVATLRAVQLLGVRARRAGQTLWITGQGRDGLSPSNRPLDLGNSGTGLRLLAGVVAGCPFRTVLTGDASIRRRPMRRVVEPLRQMGAEIAGRKDGEFAPLTIHGRPDHTLRGIRYLLPVASAQVKSALLFAGLWAEGRTTVVEPVASRDHTERLLRHIGVCVEGHGLTVSVEGPVRVPGGRIEVPGDLSSAAFWLVAGLLVEDGDLTVENVGLNPLRTGIFDVLQEMGADLTVTPAGIRSGEPIGQARAVSSRLHGTVIKGDLIPRVIDELPILCVAAALAEGETVIADAAELRVKETDRITAMARALRVMGATVEERPDGLRIMGMGGVGRLRGGTVRSLGDHRTAMALSIAGLVAEGETMVQDTACIRTSYPGFEDMLASLTRRGRARTA